MKTSSNPVNNIIIIDPPAPQFSSIIVKNGYGLNCVDWLGRGAYQLPVHFKPIAINLRKLISSITQVYVNNEGAYWHV